MLPALSCVWSQLHKSHDTAHYPSLVFHIICMLPFSCIWCPPGYEGQNDGLAGASQRSKMPGAGTHFLFEEGVWAGVSGHVFSSDLPDEHLCVYLLFYVVLTWGIRYV